MQPSGTTGRIYKRFFSPACVSRRKFYEAVHSAAVNLFLHFAKIKTPSPALPSHICLSLCVACVNETCLSNAKSESSLFILIVSGRGNKKEVSLFNIRQ